MTKSSSSVPVIPVTGSAAQSRFQLFPGDCDYFERVHIEAPTRDECERLRDELCTWLRARGQEPAAACLERDWQDFVTFYNFPEDHWIHLRTTNPIESTFATVRLREGVTKGAGSRTAGLVMAFKLLQAAEGHWRSLDGAELVSYRLFGAVEDLLCRSLECLDSDTLMELGQF